MDWRDACIVPLHKGKDEKYECGNLRGIIKFVEFSVKLYDIVLIKRVRAGTQCAIGKNNVGLVEKCIDQVFAVRPVVKSI